jgi:hypothetical protein
MKAQDVSFANGTVRISVKDRTTDPAMPLFVAQLSLVDDDGSRLHPLVVEGGYRAEIHGTSEALVLSSAISFLQTRFGALSENEHASADFAPRAQLGAPIEVRA